MIGASSINKERFWFTLLLFCWLVLAPTKQFYLMPAVAKTKLT